MRCHSCNNSLSDNELLVNSEDAFVNNECLCLTCLSISNNEVNTMLEEQQNKKRPKQ